MRPKFRIWDKVNGCWFEPTYEAYKQSLQDISITLRGELLMRTFTEPAIHESIFPDRYEVNMYIGLKDRHEKEMYEGDRITLHQFLFDGEEYENELKGTIVYDESTCSFALTDIEHKGIKKYMGYGEDEDCGNIPIFNFYGLHEESFEVIGNKYQSKEGVRDE